MKNFLQRLVPKIFSHQQKERRRVKSIKNNINEVNEILSDTKHAREMLDMPEDATFGEIRAEIDKRTESINKLEDTMEWAENEMKLISKITRKRKK